MNPTGGWPWTAAGPTLAAGGAGLLLLFAVVWRLRRRAGWPALALVLVAAVLWGGAAAMELARAGQVGVGGEAYWADLKYLGICLLPPAWILFVLRYTGRGGWLSLPTVLLLAVEPIGVLSILANAQTHDLIQATRVAGAGGVETVHGGRLLAVHAGYSAALLGIGTIVLASTLLRLSRVYRRAGSVLLAALALPWLAAGARLLRPEFLGGVDPTPFACLLTALVLVWGVVRVRLPLIAPLGRGLVLETIHDGVLVLDPSGRIADLNTAAQAVLRVASTEAAGRPLAELLPQASGLVAAGPALQQARTELAIHDPVPNLTRWYELTRTVLRDQFDTPIGQVVVLHDVTARRRAENELRVSQAQLQTVIANAPVLLFACDAKGVCTMLEGHALTTLGIDPDELTGRPLFGTSAAIDPLGQHVYRALQGESFSAVVRLGELAFSTRYEAIRDGAGLVSGVIGVATDVTGVQRAEGARADLARRLISAQEDERRRLAGELHDDAVQVLAATMTDFAALAARLTATLPTEDFARLKGQVERVQANLAAGLAAVRSFLLDLRPPLLDTEGLAAAVAQLLDGMAAQHGWRTELTWGVSHRLDPDRETVAFRTISEALVNVATHARAHQVTIRARQQEGAVVIEVADDGVGFDQEAAERRVPVFGHLGLRSMRERVESIGGVFELHSNPGRGTRVTIWVPSGAAPR
jgi:PAS domain S-box-containing protein